MTYRFGLSDYFTDDAVACALIGGLLLGCSVIFKTSVLSGVMGISNYTKRMLVEIQIKRYFFIAGMLVAGAVVSNTYGAFEPLPPPDASDEQRGQLFIRVAIGGFLVGVGATMQHGCTSGHGLTGLARFNPKSWVAVPTFMAAGALTATLSNSAASFPAHPVTEAEVPDWYFGLVVLGGVGLVLAAFAAAAFLIGRRGNDKHMTAALFAGEFLAGIGFGCGLAVSGMARPSKVAAFLDLGSGSWDMSLAFVMGGALMLTFPYFQALDRLKFQKKSFLCKEGLDLPKVVLKLPDRTAVVGAVIFGIGWGTCGMCPGPIWVNVSGTPSWEVIVCLIGLLLGISTWELGQRLQKRKVPEKQPKVVPVDESGMPEPAKAESKETAPADEAAATTPVEPIQAVDVA